jgi:hypothetical protein
VCTEPFRGRTRKRTGGSVPTGFGKTEDQEEEEKGGEFAEHEKHRWKGTGAASSQFFPAREEFRRTGPSSQRKAGAREKAQGGYGLQHKVELDLGEFP